MAAPKRLKLERERDLQRLSDHYLKGFPQWKIAEEFGVTQQQISRDLKTLRVRWLESSMRNMDELVAQELAKIDKLEAEYWAAWERSVGQRQKRTTERTNLNEGQRDKAAVITEDMAGDPRYLQGVDKCIERRCKLLGLDSPTKIAPTDPTGSREYRGGGLSALLDDAQTENDDGVAET